MTCPSEWSNRTSPHKNHNKSKQKTGLIEDIKKINKETIKEKLQKTKETIKNPSKLYKDGKDFVKKVIDEAQAYKNAIETLINGKNLWMIFLS